MLAILPLRSGSPQRRAAVLDFICAAVFTPAARESLQTMSTRNRFFAFLGLLLVIAAVYYFFSATILLIWS